MQLKKALEHEYKLDSIPEDFLLSYKGFQVLLDHWEHILSKYPEFAKEHFESLYYSPGEGRERVINYARAQASKAEIARSRINYGIQVSGLMGSLVNRVVGIRVIGAESRLEARNKKRGIRDLDLVIDSPKLNGKEIESLVQVQKDAESKTGIEVDFLCNGKPLTSANMEHMFSGFDYPLKFRGFPVFWRNEKYLELLREMKNSYVDLEIPQTMSILNKAKEEGLYLGRIDI